MAFITIPNDALPVTIPGRANRKAIVIQNRGADPVYVNPDNEELQADSANGVRLEQFQSLSLVGARGEASVPFHIAKAVGAGAGSVCYVEVV